MTNDRQVQLAIHNTDTAEVCCSRLVVVLPKFVVQTELLSVVYLLRTRLDGLPLVQAGA